MGNLKFNKVDQDIMSGVYYQIYNKKEQYLGEIRKKRIGRFMHWCFCPDFGDEFEEFAVGDLYFTNGCLKEISSFITKLYGEDRK